MTHTPNPIAQGFAQGVANFAQAYTNQKQQQNAQRIVNDPNSTPIQKAMALASVGQEKLAASAYSDMAKTEQSKIAQANDAKVMQSMGISGQENSSQSQQPATSTPNMQDLSKQIQNRALPQEMPMGGFGLTGKQYAPVPQLPQQSQEASGTPQTMSDVLMSKSIPELLDLQGKLQDPNKQKMIGKYIDAKQKEDANSTKIQVANLKNQQRQKEFDASQYQQERSYSTTMSDDFVKEIEGLNNALPIKEQALNLAQQAIDSGDVGALSGANLSRRFNLPELNSPAGSGLNLASKIFLVGNLADVTARAQNKYLEQVMATAFPMAGQSMAANNIVMEGVRASFNLSKAKQEIGAQLIQEDLKRLGYVDKDISYRTQERLKPIEENILNKMSYRSKVIQETEKSEEQLIKKANKQVPNGTFLTRRMLRVIARTVKNDTNAALERAHDLGYKIPTNKQLEEWQK